MKNVGTILSLLSHVALKFSMCDWMGAYDLLKNDRTALRLYMQAFDCLDDGSEDVEEDRKLSENAQTVEATIVEETRIESEERKKEKDFQW